MKTTNLMATIVAISACSGCADKQPPNESGGASGTKGSTMTEVQAVRFRPMREMPYGQHFGSNRTVTLPVPIRSPAGLRLALLLIGDVTARAGRTPEEAARESQSVTVPWSVHYLDAITGELAGQTLELNEDRARHFGLPDPAGYVVGHLDDPNRLPEARVEKLRQRVLVGLDTLLPLFADEHLPWTDDANKAARDVRDFFPLAAEPGLWPYYRAEGKEFFAWLEKNAPPGKARLPWDDEKK